MGKTNFSKFMYIYAPIHSTDPIYTTTGKYAEYYAGGKHILCHIYYWKGNRRGRLSQMVFEEIK